MSLRLGEYDRHYCRKAVHHKLYYEEGEKKGLEYVTRLRLQEYRKLVNLHYQNNAEMYKTYAEHLKKQVEQWTLFVGDS